MNVWAFLKRGQDVVGLIRSVVQLLLLIFKAFD